MSESDTVEPAPAAPAGLASAWAVPLFVTALSTVACWLAFAPERSGKAEVLMIMGGTYLALSLGAILWLRRRGELKQRLLPARGDIAAGALVAIGLYLIALVAHLGLTAPGRPFTPWIMRVYAQLGDPLQTASFKVGLPILCIAMLEEITWRGWVMPSLERAHGPRRAWLFQALLYAACHLPTATLLGDPQIGPNPLVIAAALGCGLVWGYIAMRVERLGPSLAAHAIFTWSIVEFPLWRP